MFLNVKISNKTYKAKFANPASYYYYYYMYYDKRETVETAKISRCNDQLVCKLAAQSQQMEPICRAFSLDTSAKRAVTRPATGKYKMQP